LRGLPRTSIQSSARRSMPFIAGRLNEAGVDRRVSTSV
jgi:hypothetical protein